MHIFGDKMQTKILYTIGLGVFHEGEVAYASKCIKCGKCEKHCPQNLPIRNLLDDVSGEMEGIITKVLPPIFKAYLAFDRFMIGRKTSKTEG